MAPLEEKQRKIGIDDLLSKVVYLEQQLSITKVELAVKSADLLVTEFICRALVSRAEIGKTATPREYSQKKLEYN